MQGARNPLLPKEGVMDGIILTVALIALLLIFAFAGIFGAITGSWSDEKREKWGLGPKGQGRDW